MRGWGGGIRTPECMDQNHVPYHLATPQYEFVLYAQVPPGGNVLVQCMDPRLTVSHVSCSDIHAPYHLVTPQYIFVLHRNAGG